MMSCNFEKLVQLLDKQLSVDDKLDVLDHVEHCEPCREAIYHISRDRDEEYFIYRPYRTDKMFAG